MSNHYDPKVAARKSRNVEIFKETLKICCAGGYSGGHTKVVLPSEAEVAAATRFYERPGTVYHVPQTPFTKIAVLNADCVEVARDLVDKGFRPVMLNMASRRTPGGGVLTGCRAQEETLFRRSNLAVSLYRYSDYHAQLLGLRRAPESYPMNRETGGIYSGRVTFFRKGPGDDDRLVADPFECAVVSVAAVNRPELDPRGGLVPWAKEAMAEKIRTILRIALLNGHDSIVLSAFGCGAFGNPPFDVAYLFAIILQEQEFQNKFYFVRFAIIEDHNSNNRNYEAFARMIGNRGADESPVGLVLGMKRFAMFRHRRISLPRKYTGAPFFTHPAAVVRMLESWGYSENDEEDAITLAIAWGHDLVDESYKTLDDLHQVARDGEVVLGIKRLSYRCGEYRDRDEYIRTIARECTPGVVVVKIAERLCSALELLACGDIQAKEYLRGAEPLFARIDECKGAEMIKETLRRVREQVEGFVDPGFPKRLTARMLANFETCACGSTHPRIGVIKGRRFIAKCGSWSEYSSDEHVHNEVVADNFLRAAGFNVPISREYKVDFDDGRGPQTIRLAVYDASLAPLMTAWEEGDRALREKIRSQVLAAYPVLSFIGAIDSITFDNVRVDSCGRLWFVDNGASFNFRARGHEKVGFSARTEVDDPKWGYLSLVNHKDQKCLRKILGGVGELDLWKAATAVPFVELVMGLPYMRCSDSLMKYAMALEKAVFMHECHIAGTSHVDCIIEKTSQISTGSYLVMRRDYANEYDQYAIALETAHGVHLGWIPQKYNEPYARLMDAGKVLVAKVVYKELKGKWLNIRVSIGVKGHCGLC